jgi:hypothetical protein
VCASHSILWLLGTYIHIQKDVDTHEKRPVRERRKRERGSLTSFSFVLFLFSPSSDLLPMLASKRTPEKKIAGSFTIIENI